ARRPEDLVAIGLSGADRPLEILGEGTDLLAVSARRFARRTRQLADHLAQRPERDPFPVWHAAADEDRRLGLGERGELLRQPRLADPSRTEDREQVQGLLPDDGFERLPQPGELAPAADQRGSQRSHRGALAIQAEKPPCDPGIGLGRPPPRGAVGGCDPPPGALSHRAPPPPPRPPPLPRRP